MVGCGVQLSVLANKTHLADCKKIRTRRWGGCIPHPPLWIRYWPKLSLNFFISLFVCKIIPWTWSLNRWTDFDMRYTKRRVFTQGSAFWGSEHSTLTSSPPKPHLFGTHNGKPMANTYSHNCMMHRAMMLKFGRLFDLAKHLEHTH